MISVLVPVVAKVNDPRPPLCDFESDFVTVRPPYLPVPLNVTACGLVGSLSVMVSEADREPPASGAKVIEMLHDPKPGRELPQVSWVNWKSPVFAPVTCNGDIDSEAVLRLLIDTTFVLPVFPTLTVPKLIDVGLFLIAVRPFPVTFSVSGLLPAFPDTIMVAEIEPTTVGVNTTI